MTREVTVVIPTRDRCNLLRRALHSALGQRDVGLQVVVVDEASSDATPLELARVRDDRLVVCGTTNRWAWPRREIQAWPGPMASG